MRRAIEAGGTALRRRRGSPPTPALRLPGDAPHRAAPPPLRLRPHHPAEVLALQRLVGNAQVSRLIDQGRSPSGPVAALPRLGSPTAVQRFDPRHHRSALVEGLKDSGFSAADVGAIYAANWERDFSQAHPALGRVVIVWKMLQAAIKSGDDTAVAVAGSALRSAVYACLNPATVKDITKGAYGGYAYYEHMDNPAGPDLDPKDTWWPWEAERRRKLRDELLKKTPSGIPQYLADARDYTNAQLIRAAEAALGRQFAKTSLSGWSKSEWEAREKSLAGKIPVEAASVGSSGTAVIADEATAQAKAVMKPGHASLGPTLPSDAVDALGRASHALEDFFAHSNFVDIAIGYDPDNRKAADAATDTSLRTGTFGPKSQKHSISHKIHAIVDQARTHPIMMLKPVRDAVRGLSELATKLEKESMAADEPGSHTRLAKDQPAWGGSTAEDELKTLRFELAHRCAVAADREIIGGIKNVIAFGTADPSRADAQMEYVSRQLFEMIAPPTPTHPLWNILDKERAPAAALIARL